MRCFTKWTLALYEFLVQSEQERGVNGLTVDPKVEVITYDVARRHSPSEIPCLPPCYKSVSMHGVE